MGSGENWNGGEGAGGGTVVVRVPLSAECAEVMAAAAAGGGDFVLLIR